MQIIDGKKISAQIKEEIAEKVKEVVAAGGRRPNLVGVLVGIMQAPEDLANHQLLLLRARAANQRGAQGHGQQQYQ